MKFCLNQNRNRKQEFKANLSYIIRACLKKQEVFTRSVRVDMTFATTYFNLPTSQMACNIAESVNNQWRHHSTRPGIPVSLPLYSLFLRDFLSDSYHPLVVGGDNELMCRRLTQFL